MICCNFLETVGKYLNFFFVGSMPQTTDRVPCMDFLKTHQLASSLKQESLKKVVIFSKKKLEMPLLSCQWVLFVAVKNNCHGHSANRAT